MAQLFEDFLNANLIPAIDGNDQRLSYMKKTVSALAKKMKAKPILLIQALLAGLTPNVPSNDPSIIMAEELLTKEWKAMRSAYPDTQVPLMRLLLLSACDECNEGKLAIIIWLLASDNIAFQVESREARHIQAMLERSRAQYSSITKIFLLKNMANGNADQVLQAASPQIDTKLKVGEFEKEAILLKVAAATGPAYKGADGQPVQLENPNPNWPHPHMQLWANIFANRMSQLLVDYLNSTLQESEKILNKVQGNIQAAFNELTSEIDSKLTEHFCQTNALIQNYDNSLAFDRMRTNALWWYESLYSSSLHCGYRELDVNFASVLMSMDCLDLFIFPAPIDSGYILIEALGKLTPTVDDFIKIKDIFIAFQKYRLNFPEIIKRKMSKHETEGRYSLRDIIYHIVHNEECDITDIMKKAAIPEGTEISVKSFSLIIFKQEQAFRLAAEK